MGRTGKAPDHSSPARARRRCGSASSSQGFAVSTLESLRSSSAGPGKAAAQAKGSPAVLTVHGGARAACTPRSPAAQTPGRAAEGCASGLLQRDVAAAGLVNGAAQAEDAAMPELQSEGQALQLVAEGSAKQQRQAAAAQTAARRHSGSAASTSSAPGDGDPLPPLHFPLALARYRCMPWWQAECAVHPCSHVKVQQSDKQAHDVVTHACAGVCVSALSERALAYGWRMLERSGGGLRPSVATGNAYERRLLADVVHPEHAGSGFAEVCSDHDGCSGT